MGSVTVRAGGQTFDTDPLPLVVTAGPPPPQQQQAAGAQEAQVAPDDLFVEVTLNRTRVYENQPVIAEYRIYTRVNVESYTITALPSAACGWTLPGLPPALHGMS